MGPGTLVQVIGRSGSGAVASSADEADFSGSELHLEAELSGNAPVR